jgi:hypothetical protein
MSVKFLVERTVHLPSANVFAIEGRVLVGKVNAGDVFCVCNEPVKCVKVKSIALINERERSGLVTLSVEEPKFPLNDLIGSEMISAESAAATTDVTEGER